MKKFTGEYDEILRGVLLLVLLALLVWRYLTAVSDVLTPLFLALLIVVVAFGMRIKWARGVGYFVAALAVVWFFSIIWKLLFPFVAAFVIAYLLSPIVAALDERGVPRGLSAFVLILLALMAVAAALLMIVPPVIGQITRLVASLNNLPGEMETFFGNANDWFSTLEEYEPSPYAKPIIDNLILRAQDLFAALFERVLAFVTSLSSARDPYRQHHHNAHNHLLPPPRHAED